MTNLISRADAIKAIRKCKFESVMPSDWYRGMECAQDIVEALPSAEAVEVVRCKDCKYKRLYDEGETKYYYCALEDRPNRNWSVDDTDYCSWGERREESEVEE